MEISGHSMYKTATKKNVQDWNLHCIWLQSQCS